ncbi:MAG TPA: protein-glutamate O-methyltransferase CheR [bacterium]|jgi:chemotaxis protein methyltransferase CheR|nr:protein-glutamate O-methyltransferase CheR [bacterium]
MTTATLYFDFIRRLVQERCGVLLESDKEYLMSSLLEPALGKWGMDSMAELMARLWQEPQGPLSQSVVETMIPGETYFFRDPLFFEALEKKVLPELVEKRKGEKRLSIWSAACSSGQEPYSVALLIKEKFPFLFQWDLILAASDFSRGALDRAKQGRYSALEVGRGLPAGYLAKYFRRLESDWQVNDDIRSAIDFKEINLKAPSMEGSRIDLILLRNVMIYFEVEMKINLLSKLQKSLRPDGYLFLGTSETTLFLENGFQSAAFEGSITGYQSRR